MQLGGKSNPLLFLRRDQPLVQRADLTLLLLALRQVDDEGHSLVSVLLEGGYADQHGHAAAVLPEVLLLEWLQSPALRELGDQPLIAFAPFRGSQVPPDQATSGEILAVVSHDGEERVVRVDDPPFELSDEDADDVGVDQTSDP
jgi:hypothetical protein